MNDPDPLSLNHQQRRLRELRERLESRLHTVQVIAEIILDNAAFREGFPGPWFGEYREGALMDAVVQLSRSNLEDFSRLLEMQRAQEE